MDPHSPFHPEAVGRPLTAFREHHNLTRAELAASVQIDATSYGRIEKGLKPLKAEMAFKIVERYGVSMDFLYRVRLTELPPPLADTLMKYLNQRQP